MTTPLSNRMTVSEIVSYVKRQFGDEAGSQITDTDIIRWINLSMRDIALKNELLQVRAVDTVNNNQQTVALPDNMITLHSLRCGPVKLKSFSMQEYDTIVGDNATTKGQPTNFFVWAGSATLYPVPDKDYNLVLFYTRHPVPVVDLTDTPELAAIYHNRILEFCMAQAYMLDDNPSSQAMHMQAFDSGLSSSRENTDWDRRDEYPMIGVGIDDYGYGTGGGY